MSSENIVNAEHVRVYSPGQVPRDDAPGDSVLFDISGNALHKHVLAQYAVIGGGNPVGVPHPSQVIIRVRLWVVVAYAAYDARRREPGESTGFASEGRKLHTYLERIKREAEETEGHSGPEACLRVAKHRWVAAHAGGAA